MKKLFPISQTKLFTVPGGMISTGFSTIAISSSFLMMFPQEVLAKDEATKGPADTTPPTVTIAAIGNAADAPTSVAVTFDEDITGFDINDLVLLNPVGHPQSLPGVSIYAADMQNFYVQGLESLDLKTGPHVLAVNPIGSGIQDLSSNVIVDGDAEGFAITGTAEDPIFSSSGVFTPFGIGGTDNYSAPAFGDLDGDGDYDCFVGNFSGDFDFFENTGSPTSPAFSVYGDNPYGLSNYFGCSTPRLVDIDADGDLDLLSGSSSIVVFFENTGTPTSPAFTYTGVVSSIGASTPTFTDLQTDGDFDALNGNVSGQFIFSDNTGSAFNPQFGLDIISAYGLGTIGDDSAPVFVDFDGDGDMDIIAGDEGTNPYLFRNTGSPSSPQFTLEGIIAGIYDYYWGLRPAVVDIDADGDLDVFTGDYLGFIRFFENSLTSIPPILYLSEESYDFGDFELGGIGTYGTITVQNLGEDDLVTTTSLIDDGDGDFFLTEIPTSPLIEGQSDYLRVILQPDSLGPTSGTVSLETNTSSGTVNIVYVANGVDTLLPISEVTSPTVSLVQMSPIIEIEYTSSDFGSGVESVELFYRFTSSKGPAYTSGGTFTSSPIMFDTTAIGSSGVFDFYTLATDFAGNTEAVPGSPDVTINFNNTSSVDEWQNLEMQ